RIDLPGQSGRIRGTMAFRIFENDYRAIRHGTVCSGRMHAAGRPAGRTGTRRQPREQSATEMTTKKKPEELRSYRWFGPDTMRAFGHRSRMMQLGYRREDFTGKPVIAIVNTW